MVQSHLPTPLLQPPGAGLPWWELIVARYMVFPRACRKLTWSTAAEQFQREGSTILELWDASPPEHLTQRILIPRFPGMEDSSRYWSIVMTVEHLNIVGRGIRQTIQLMRRGEVPDSPALIQQVKPSGEVEAYEVRTQFAQLLADAAAAELVESPISPGAGPRYAHPWFGKLDAYQWHCLLGIHQAIHRRQIEAIRKGLAD